VVLQQPHIELERTVQLGNDDDGINTPG